MPEISKGDLMLKLENKPLKVINLGLESFADDLKSMGVKVESVDWKPPLPVDKAMREKIKANYAKKNRTCQSSSAGDH
jgi:hypothetical protein